eukprot:TRINITY_DN29869_c0_g1_i1.p1 TRINITY_DN29869_c0_g1~~TRINITY_DN29869_c0_g1_i1.p1  ORF type:complete len:156 (+),score=37.40 TRINITY_DN29869_c0_g1_i1:46-513(+)
MMEWGADGGALCTAEVVRLHECFEGWFNGTLSDADGGFAAIAAVLPADFWMVPPSGETVANPALLARLEQLRHCSKHGATTIEVRNVRVVHGSPTACLISYEEWQRTPLAEGAVKASARISSALLRPADNLYGVEWVHLQETWLPDQGRPMEGVC